MEELKNQPCPAYGQKKTKLREEEIDTPYFGKTAVFSMSCENCKFSKYDIESIEQKDPIKVTSEINSEKDLRARVIRSSYGLVKIPQLKMSLEPGENVEGFITNIEGLLKKFEDVLIEQRDNTDEDDVRKTAKNLLKKLWKVKLGELPLKIIIEDKTGNSAIISDKTVVEKIKK